MSIHDPARSRPLGSWRRPALVVGLVLATAAMPVGTASAASGPPGADPPPAVVTGSTAQLAAPSDGFDVSWLAGGTLTAAEAAAQGLAAPAGASAGLGGPDDLAAGPPQAGGGDQPEPVGGLISNQGCVQAEVSKALPHGQNCIDRAAVYMNGVIRVHAQVPATIGVNLSESPAVEGSAVGNVHPLFNDGVNDHSDTLAYDFTSKQLPIHYSTHYWVAATAFDSAGNVSWRYGEITTPGRYIDVTFDELVILDDADKGFLNDGEIKFRGSVNGVQGDDISLPEQKLGLGGVHLPADTTNTFVIDDDDKPSFVYQGIESDPCKWWDGPIDPCFDKAEIHRILELPDHDDEAWYQVQTPPDTYLAFGMKFTVRTYLH